MVTCSTYDMVTSQGLSAIHMLMLCCIQQCIQHMYQLFSLKPFHIHELKNRTIRKAPCGNSWWIKVLRTIEKRVERGLPKKSQPPMAYLHAMWTRAGFVLETPTFGYLFFLSTPVLCLMFFLLEQLFAGHLMQSWAVVLFSAQRTCKLQDWLSPGCSGSYQVIHSFPFL